MRELAEIAFFRVERGKKDDGTKNMVTGETIDLARELSRCWRNMVSGHKEVGRDAILGQSEVLAYAWDLENGNRREQTIYVPHQRGKYRVKDGGSIREIIAGYAARVEREMIFACLPAWFKVQAIDLCHQTLANIDADKGLEQRIADCKAMFYGIDVMADALERKIGRPSTEFTPEDLAVLGVIYKSIRRGQSTKDDEFPPPPPKTEELPANADPFEKAASGSVGAPPSDGGSPPKEAEATAATDDKPDPELARANDFVRMVDEQQTPPEIENLLSNGAVKRTIERWRKEKPALAQMVDQAKEARLQILRAAA